MDPEKRNKLAQDIGNSLDTLFSRVIDGTSLHPDKYEAYYDEIRRLTTKIEALADAVNLERIKKSNEAISKAFTLMEKELDKRFEELENKLSKVSTCRKSKQNSTNLEK